MSGFRVQSAAEDRIGEIYLYTRDAWGESQARAYLDGLYARFAAIAMHDFPWRPVPAEFGVSGYVSRYRHHLIYWKILSDDTIGIVTVLHERMHQIERFRDDFA